MLANRAKFNMHLENAQKQEMRRAAMDSVKRKKRDDLDKREAEAANSAAAAEKKKQTRKGSSPLRLEVQANSFSEMLHLYLKNELNIILLY